MRYYKVINNGLITMIGYGGSIGVEITETEYNNILSVIKAIPEAPKGYGYNLTENLEWELYENPIIEIEEEITDNEALSIILGGGM